MDFKRIATERVYSGRLLKIDKDKVELPNGQTTELEMVRHPGAAAIVPFVSDEDVLLIRQFRYATGGFIYEVPAGTLHKGESPVACARREIQEEIGHKAGSLRLLASIFTTPGFTDEVIHLFVARELIPVEQKLDHDEVLTVERIPFADAIEMVRDGRIKDAKSICALLLAREPNPRAAVEEAPEDRDS